jgi:DNA-binding NtrC family response regulator
LKLLRFLEEGTFIQAGGVRNVDVDVRVVASTTRELGEMTADGSFRRDLFDRLHVPIVLPPLRERDGDISRLTAHFLARFGAEFGMGVREPTPAAMAILEHHSWPGNVRQLRQALERVMLLLDSHWIEADDLGFLTSDVAPPQFRLPRHGVNLEDVERQLLQQALERTHGNYTRTGRLLGINRDQVRYRVEKFGIDVSASRATT